MKDIKFQATVSVPDNYQLSDRDDILQLLYDFPHKIVYLDGKVIK